MLVIVTGPPASGKTFVAEGLAQAIGLPLLAKDDIKEIFFDIVGHETREQSRRYGAAAIALLHHFAGQILSSGGSVIVECNFRPDMAAEELRDLQRKTACDMVQVHVDAPTEVLIARFGARWREGRRHPGHHDDENFEAIVVAIDQHAYGVIDLDAPLFCVDTRDFDTVDLDALAERLRRRLK